MVFRKQDLRGIDESIIDMVNRKDLAFKELPGCKRVIISTSKQDSKLGICQSFCGLSYSRVQN